MNLHGQQTNLKPPSILARLARIAVLVVLLGAAWLVFSYRDTIWSRVSSVLAATAGDPVPTAELVREPFQLAVPAIGEIVGLDSVPVPTPSTPAGSLKVAWLVAEGSFVQSGDPVIRFDPTDARLNLERSQNTLQANQERTGITTSKQATDEKVLTLDRTDAELEYDYAMTVLPQDETIFSKWDIIEAQINAGFAKERIDFLRNKARTQQRIARSDQQILAIERNKAQSEIGTARQTLNSLELLTPSEGLVLYRRERRRDPQVGDESQPGQVLLEVVDLRTLQARIYVLERDAGSLAKGQEVLIQLDAIPEKQFLGVIRNVSAMAQSLERNSPLRYFACEVTISDPGEDLRRIRPGMALRADVIMERYESCFVVPTPAVTFRDKENLVYIRQADTFVSKPVEIGLSTHGQITILQGVEEGQMIALRNPFETRKLALPDFSKGAAGEQGGRGGPGKGGMMRMIIH